MRFKIILIAFVILLNSNANSSTLDKNITIKDLVENGYEITQITNESRSAMSQVILIFEKKSENSIFLCELSNSLRKPNHKVNCFDITDGK